MNLLMLFAAVTVATFVWRLLGLTVPIAHRSAFLERFLHFVPISIFTALLISALYTAPELLPLKMAALVVAGVIAVRTRHFGLSMLVGMATLWILISVEQII